MVTSLVAGRTGPLPVLTQPPPVFLHFRGAGRSFVLEKHGRSRSRRQRLEAVEVAGGDHVACEVLFAHPPQRHVELVHGLGLGLDEGGFVQVDPMKRETSIAGMFAAGDLTTRMQAAIAAAAGMQAAAAINLELTLELTAAAESSTTPS